MSNTKPLSIIHCTMLPQSSKPIFFSLQMHDAFQMPIKGLIMKELLWINYLNLYFCRTTSILKTYSGIMHNVETILSHKSICSYCSSIKTITHICWRLNLILKHLVINYLHIMNCVNVFVAYNQHCDSEMNTNRF